MSKIIKIKVSSANPRVGSQAQVFPGKKLSINVGKPIYLYLDATCFEDNQMPETTIKWAVVYDKAFRDAEKENVEVPAEFWGLVNQSPSTPINYYGMNINYKESDRLQINVVGEKQMYYDGYLQRVLVFTDNPSDAFVFYFYPLFDGKIQYAYFTNSEKLWNYGDIVELEVATHNLHSYQDTSLYFQYFVVEDTAENAAIGKDNNLQNISFKEIEKASVWQSEVHRMPEIESYYARGANQTFKCQLLIDYDNWRKGEIKEKEFSVIAIAYYENWLLGILTKKVAYFENFLINPVSDMYEYNSTYLGVKDLDGVKGSVSSRIRVNPESMGEIFARKELEKNNQIALIGDIAYSIREYDPCGYSKITISDGVKVKDVFSEDDLTVIDKTNEFFSIVAGDNPKKITITVEHLTTDGECKGILLEGGHTHKNIENVFIIGEVYTSLPSPFDPKNAKQEKIVNEQDNTHYSIPKVEQLNKDINVNESKSNDNNYEGTGHVYEIDRDHKGTTGLAEYDYDPVKQYKIIGTKSLGWIPDTGSKHGGDITTFKLEKNDEKGIMTINNLFYRFNKNILEGSLIRKYLTASFFDFIKEIKEGLIDQLWMFNYFFPHDYLKQTYFIPVSSCRYPNQLVQIFVFPDVKWEISILIKPKDNVDFYRSTNLPDGNKGKVVAMNNKRHWKSTMKSMKVKNGKIDSKLYNGEFHLKCILKNEVFDLGASFQDNINDVLAVLVNLKMALDELCHRNVAAKMEDGTKKALPKIGKALKSPGFIEFSLPALSIGGGWRFDYPAGSDEIKSVGYLKIGFEPLLRAKGGIDLLALAAKVAPVGALLTALDYVQVGLNWISNRTGVAAEVELILNLYTKGEIKGYYYLDYLNPTETKTDLRVQVAIGIEFIFRIKATIEKVYFVQSGKEVPESEYTPVEGEDGEEKVIKEVGFEAQLNAEVETGFEGKVTIGVNDKGTYLDAKLDYLGITLKVVGKLTVFSTRGNPKKDNYNLKANLVNRYEGILKTEKMYIL